MNKEYIQAGNNFVVSTDSGLKKVQRLDNMTEILQTENNIEEIENLKRKNGIEELFDFDDIFNYIEKKFFKKVFSISIPIAIAIGILTAIFTNTSVAILVALTLFSGTGAVAYLSSEIINFIKSGKINKAMCEKADILLDEELENQKQKDKILHIDAKVLADNDLGILGETIKIENSKLIENLKRKLELIKDYQLMKKDLMKFSDDYLLLSLKLECMSYSENDINFIYMLMKQDIEQEEKQKTLKLEKK